MGRFLTKGEPEYLLKSYNNISMSNEITIRKIEAHPINHGDNSLVL